MWLVWHGVSAFQLKVEAHWLSAGAGGTSHVSSGRPRHSTSSQPVVEPLPSSSSAMSSRGQRHSVSDVDETAAAPSSSRRSAFLEPLSRSSSAATDSVVSSPTQPSSATGETTATSIDDTSNNHRCECNRVWLSVRNTLLHGDTWSYWMGGGSSIHLSHNSSC